jgi:hypothetical protein
MKTTGSLSVRWWTEIHHFSTSLKQLLSSIQHLLQLVMVTTLLLLKNLLVFVFCTGKHDPYEKIKEYQRMNKEIM